MPTPPAASRWTGDSSVPRGASYDERWEKLAAAGKSVHGEADFVSRWAASLAVDQRAIKVLDAGCGTGRVAVELARRGFATIGADLDDAMLTTAREKAPTLDWRLADLASLELGPEHRDLDIVVMAGNVMIFVAPGTEAAVVAACASHLRPGGLLIAGFQLRPGGYHTDALDADALAAGLRLRSRFSTWDEDPWTASGDYQVSVHVKS